MSMQTWLDEFYPTKAQGTASSEAVSHSLRKWYGLRAVNLDKHGVKKLAGLRVITDTERDFFIDDNSCALCFHYDGCKDCPLALILDEKSCDDGPDSPYQIWRDRNDSEPMIALLERLYHEE